MPLCARLNGRVLHFDGSPGLAIGMSTEFNLLDECDGNFGVVSHGHCNRSQEKTRQSAHAGASHDNQVDLVPVDGSSDRLWWPANKDLALIRDMLCIE